MDQALRPNHIVGEYGAARLPSTAGQVQANLATVDANQKIARMWTPASTSDTRSRGYRHRRAEFARHAD